METVMGMLTDDVRQKLLNLNLVGFATAPVAPEAKPGDAALSTDGLAKTNLTKSGMVKSGLCKVGLAHKAPM